MADIPKFGVKFVGKTFEWGVVDPATHEVSVKQFRAKASYSYDGHLEYESISAQLQAHVVERARRARRELAMAADDSVTDEELMKMLNDSRELAVKEEAEEWRKVVNQSLLLIDERDVDELGPLLLNGDPAEVRALRVWLEEVVLGRVQKEVEAVASVDPTLLPPPSPSSGTPASGLDGDSTESTSTD